MKKLLKETKSNVKGKIWLRVMEVVTVNSDMPPLIERWS